MNFLLIQVFLYLLLVISFLFDTEAIQMSSRYYTNLYPDYDENVGSKYLKEGTFQYEPNLVTEAQRLKTTLLSKINKSIYTYDNNSDYSVYTGYCGIALLHYHIYIKNADSDSLQIAQYLTDKALKNLNGKDVSFLIGDAGPLALAAVIAAEEKREDVVKNLCERLIKLPEIVSKFPDEMLFGRAGYIYGLLFVQKRIPDAIPKEHIKKHIRLLVDSGKRKAQKDNFSCPLKYKWHGENYLGAAHGLAGILYIILNNIGMLKENELETVIKPTLQWLVKKRYSSGNFPSSEGSNTDKLVQWCHGAPGFVHLFTLASQVFNDQNFMNVALDCGTVVWNRGLLQKGYSICHGASGNAYTFSHLYQITRDRKHLHRLACFLHWCNKYPENEGMRPDRPLSMFEGISGVTYFLQDLDEPLKASFPAYALN